MASTLEQIRRKYGQQAVDWIQQSIMDGTIKPAECMGKGYFTVSLKNPKFKRFLTFKDKFRIRWYGPYPEIEFADENRYSDRVAVEIDLGVSR